MKSLFNDTRIKTHMPFCDGEHFVFCASNEIHSHEFECGGEIWDILRSKSVLQARFASLPNSMVSRYRPWKIHYRPWLDEALPQQLETGLPDAAVECSPAFYQDELKQWHVSFIGGVPGRHGFAYHLYQMSGPSLDRLSCAKILLKEPTKAGFVNERYLCFIRGSSIVLRHRTTNEELILACSFAPILRVSFRASDLDQLLITGTDRLRRSQTIVHDLRTGEDRELSTPHGAYKPTLFGDQILLVKKESHDLENCEVRQSIYELTDTAVSIQSQHAAV